MFEVTASEAATISADLLSSQSAVFQETLIAGASGVPLASPESSLAGRLQDFFQTNPTAALILSLLLALWVLTVKGMSLWRAARLKQMIWFIVLFLMVNTFGLFELVYLLYLSKVNWGKLGQKFGLIKPDSDHPSQA